MRYRSLSFALAALVFLPMSGLSGQSVVLDEGTFRILVDGEEVGSEEFSIRRSGSGPDAQTIATGEIQMEVPEGRLDLRPALQAAGGEMAVSAYQIKISGHRQEEIYVTLGDRRFLTSIRSEQGEQEREYRAAAGTLLLDTGVAHQYYFVTQRFPSGGGSVAVIVPREGRQYDLRVSDVGSEELQVGDRQVSARHLRLEGGPATQEVWVDEDGRVLRVERPDAGYTAVRDQAP